MLTEVTKHAEVRLIERLGLNKKAVKRATERAFLKGKSFVIFNGSLRRYLDKLYLTHKKADNIKVFGNFIYLFRGTLLITVFELPKNYQKQMRE